jgi:type IV pilus assembly protein PilB
MEKLVKFIPVSLAKKIEICPLGLNGDLLVIGYLSGNEQVIREKVEFITGGSVELKKLNSDEFNERFLSIYGKNVSIKGKEKKTKVKTHQSKELSLANLSAVHQVNSIIKSAALKGASDIHIEPFEQYLRIRFRIDGVLRLIGQYDISLHQSILSRIKILSELDIAERRRPQDGRIKQRVQEKSFNIRVSTLPTKFGEKAVLRLLDISDIEFDFTSLGLSKTEQKIIDNALKNKHGMILATGPTGSGKTTTLYTALSNLNTVENNILTIEDPIEYNLIGINQSQVKPEIGYNFSKALTAFLRQDPDIIMLGEVRDEETARIAIRSALTGHLVLSTIHTNDAPSTIGRLIDMGVKPYLLASSLKLIIAQRLIRRICENCKAKSEASKELNQFLGLGDADGYTFQGKGCEFCNYTGYNGRTAIYEMLHVNEEISEIINNGARKSEIIRSAEKLGYRPLAESGKTKILQGITTPEEVIKSINL